MAGRQDSLIFAMDYRSRQSGCPYGKATWTSGSWDRISISCMQ